MYESPINLYMQEIMTTMENERENAITAKISESIGCDVDKGELIRALQYDRQQYNKGYADAKAMCESMLDEIRDEIKKEGEPCIYEIDFAYKHGLLRALEIIDKYRKGDEDE